MMMNILVKKVNLIGIKKLLILFAVLILQVCILLFWANTKSNLFPDEMHSFGYAKECGSGEKYEYVYMSDAWKEQCWVKNADLKEVFTIHKQDSALHLSFSDSLKYFLTDELYSWLLNLFTVTLSPGVISTRGSLLLNVLLFMVAQVILIVTIYSLTGNIEPCILGTMMFGFSGIVTGLVIYVRFYMFCISLCSLAIYLHLKILKSEKVIPNIVREGIAGILIYFSYTSSQLTIPLMGFFIITFIVVLLIRKEWKKVGIYLGVLCMGIALCWNKLSWVFNVLIHPSDYMNNNNQLTAHLIGIKEINGEKLLARIEKFRDLINVQFWGAEVVTLFLIILFAGLLFLFFSKKKGFKFNFDDVNRSFYYILLFTVVLDSLLLIFCDFVKTTRYCSFVFWPLTTVIAISFFELSRYSSKRKFLCSFLIVLELMEFIFTFFGGNIEYVFREDRELKNRLENLGEMDVVYLAPHWESHEIEARAVSDCIYLMNADTNIFPVRYDSSNLKPDDFPEQFLIWGPNEVDTGYLDEFMDAGYTIHSVGSTYASDVYICQLDGDMPGTWLYNGERMKNGNKYR